MKIVRHADAPSYAAPGHAGVEAFRLQGGEASAAEHFWIGYSIYEPGGRADMGMGDTEKAYVLLEGELTLVESDGTRHVLRAKDSCLIAPFEQRMVVNESGEQAVLLVIGATARASRD